MKFYKKIILLVLSALGIILISTATAYGWYAGFIGLKTDTNEIRLQANASYYASGIGTKEDPYIITQARHLYNLAWLQDLGYYDEIDDNLKAKEPYYFKLGANIDMNTLMYGDRSVKLPPIGINDHPFVGNFDGNGYTISNLKVSTYFTDEDVVKPTNEVLREAVDTIGADGQIKTDYLGLFGYIGSKTKGKKLDTEITNFTIANLSLSTNANKILTGFIAGYADNDISYIGVANSHFDLSLNTTNLQSQKYISNYGLIGDYNSLEGGMAWEDRPVEGSTGYGSSTDLRELYYSLLNGTSAEIKKNAAYPFRSESVDIVPIAHKKINMNLSSGVKQIETAQTQKASTKGNNLGYYVGSDIKLYIQNKVDYSKFYYPGDSAYSHELPYQNGSIKYNAPSQDIIDYLNEVKTNKDGSSYMNGNYLLRMSGRSQINFQNEDGLYAVENAQVGSWTGNLLVPNRVIWVAPIKAGTMKFVLFNPESKSMGFRLYKLIRSTPKDYSSYFSNGTYDIEFNDTLLSGKAYYFEKEISLDDINAGVEYALSAGDGYNPYIAYMDIGVDGSSLASTGTIASVDFVYEDSNEINGYSKITETNLSGVGFKLEGESTSDFLLFIFRSKDNGVQYATNGSGIVVSTFGNSATRKNSKEDFN